MSPSDVASNVSGVEVMSCALTLATIAVKKNNDSSALLKRKYFCFISVNFRFKNSLMQN